MSFLDDLHVVDIRHLLPRANWQIGTRTATTSLTWHWNGPPVDPSRRSGAGLIKQLIADSNWQMRKGWGGTKDGAPHLMYLLVIGADGTIYQTADVNEILWHCAQQDGNMRGLSLHFALGEGQEPTPLQLAAGFRVSDAARAHFGISFERVVGHLEWRHATACPGPSLMQHLAAYRAGRAPLIIPTIPQIGIRRFRILPDLGVAALVRQGPATSYAIAGRMKPGTILFIDAVKETSDPQHPRWVHMAHVEHEQADLGFVSEGLGVWL